MSALVASTEALAEDAPGAITDEAMPGMKMDEAPAPVGQDSAPPPPSDHFADRFYPSADMERARHQMMREQGGRVFRQVLLNLFEYQSASHGGNYRWDGEAWLGQDVNRLVIKSEGEGAVPGGADTAEIQALYNRAISPFFNLQAGLRYDFAPTPHHGYVTVGVEGLAPYTFQTAAALFLSEDGKLLGRIEGWYNQRITQRLVFQPRVELNLAAQDVRENGVGAGLVNAELGARLRYEFWRELAPYIGVTYSAKTGRSADFAGDAGQDPTKLAFVAGLRFWF